MGKIEQIQDAIARADRKESKLPEEVFQIGGYTSDRVRCLLNNLGAISQRYLEIGVHRGSTFVAANFANNMWPFAIDNFSELAEDGTVQNEWNNNRKKFGIDCMFYDQDCFTVDRSQINNIDFYLYDGNHSYESQKQALTYFIGCMTDEFILVVDDYNWEDVRRGTQEGIFDIGVDVLFEMKIDKPGSDPADGWWNGIYVALLKKKEWRHSAA